MDIIFKLNSPLTKDDWNLITDAEFEHSDGVTFTTPSGKEVEFRKVVRGKWEECEIVQERLDEPIIDQWQSARCSICGKYHTTPYMYYFDNFNYCPNCGAKMDERRKDEHTD